MSSQTTKHLKAPSFSGLQPASQLSSRLAQSSSTKRNTGCELVLRRALDAVGLRYVVDIPSLPGRPDIVFRAQRVIVFCDGDFWHGRHLRERLKRLSKGHNAQYWMAKIRANVVRDRRHDRALRRDGWAVLRCWESDIRKTPERVLSLVEHNSGLEQDDTWDVTRLAARIYNPGNGGLVSCQTEKPGAFIIVRTRTLTATHTNCLFPGQKLLIEFSTGSDDLRASSELDGKLTYLNGVTEQWTIKAKDATAFASNSSNTVQHNLLNTSGVGSLTLTLLEHPGGQEGNDTWKVNGIYAATGDTVQLQTCVVDLDNALAQDTPLFQLDGTFTDTFTATSGCWSK